MAQRAWSWVLLWVPLALAQACGGVVDHDRAPQPELVLTTTPFDVPPGTERLICQYFPSTDATRWLDTFDVEATPGMHHVNVYRVPDTGALPTAPFDCTNEPIPDAPMLPPTPHEMSLPPGVAYQINPGEALFFNTHFINTTEDTITSHVKWIAGLADPADVTAPAGMLFFANRKIDVPPYGTATITKTCEVPLELSMFRITGHFHEHTTRFTATLDGRPLLDLTPSTTARGFAFDPPRELGPSDALTWTCFDENSGPDPVVFGPSVVVNEMCQLSSYVYPVAGSATLTCDSER